VNKIDWKNIIFNVGDEGDLAALRVSLCKPNWIDVSLPITHNSDPLRHTMLCNHLRSGSLWKAYPEIAVSAYATMDFDSVSRPTDVDWVTFLDANNLLARYTELRSSLEAEKPTRKGTTKAPKKLPMHRDYQVKDPGVVVKQMKKRGTR